MDVLGPREGLVEEEVSSKFCPNSSSSSLKLDLAWSFVGSDSIVQEEGMRMPGSDRPHRMKKTIVMV